MLYFSTQIIYSYLSLYRLYTIHTIATFSPFQLVNLIYSQASQCPPLSILIIRKCPFSYIKLLLTTFLYTFLTLPVIIIIIIAKKVPKTPGFLDSLSLNLTR